MFNALVIIILSIVETQKRQCFFVCFYFSLVRVQRCSLERLSLVESWKWRNFCQVIVGRSIFWAGGVTWWGAKSRTQPDTLENPSATGRGQCSGCRAALPTRVKQRGGLGRESPGRMLWRRTWFCPTLLPCARYSYALTLHFFYLGIKMVKLDDTVLSLLTPRFYGINLESNQVKPEGLSFILGKPSKCCMSFQLVNLFSCYCNVFRCFCFVIVQSLGPQILNVLLL